MNVTVATGVTIRYDDFGPPDGIPVLVVYGHLFNRSMWAPQVAALARAGYRVIAPDLRGYGDSNVVPGKTLRRAFLAAGFDPVGAEVILRPDLARA